MKKITLSRNGQTEARDVEVSTMHPDGLKPGDRVMLRIKGDSLHYGPTEYQEYKVDAVTKTDRFDGKCCDIRFVKVSKTPKLPAAKATAAVAKVNPVNPVQNSPADIAGALTVQYQAVVAATGQMLREAVKFGAMLMELETIVGKAQGRDGEGIKAWLSKHCPEINYSTAIVYKNLAAKSATLIGGMGLQVVAALQGGEKVTKTDGEVIDVPAEIIEKRDALFAECDSRRKLEQAYFAFMSESGERGTGNGSGRPTRGPLPKLSQRDSAKAIWNIFMQKATNRSLKDAIPLLGEKETKVCHDDLCDLVGLLKSHLKEF